MRQSILNPIRKLIRWYFQQKSSRILDGAGKGLKWYPNASLLGFWRGSYEQPKQNALIQELKPGQVFYDLGANVGFYSVIASRAVGNLGQVIAFEPDPRNLVWLEKHKILNDFKNLQILPYAIANHEGRGRFMMELHPCLSHLSDTQGEGEVQIRKIDNMIAEGLIPPADIIKIDIEGGAHDAVLGAEKMIRVRHPLIYLAIDTNQDFVCMDLLKSWGYKFEEFFNGEFKGTYHMP
jgi:FkbM family methyltransferase